MSGGGQHRRQRRQRGHRRPALQAIIDVTLWQPDARGCGLSVFNYTQSDSVTVGKCIAVWSSLAAAAAVAQAAQHFLSGGPFQRLRR